MPAASPPPAPTRAHVLALARTWLGTPYHHQASVRGIGCDCVGLVRGVHRALYGPTAAAEADAALPYTRDWAEATGIETLITAARRHLIEIAPAAARPGDVLIFRYRPHMVAKHTGILGARLRPTSSIPELAIGTSKEALPNKPSSGADKSVPERSPDAASADALGEQAAQSNPPPQWGGVRGGETPRVLASTATPHPDLTLIHALEGAPVSEVPFHSWWQRRIAAAFSFPGIID